MLCHSDSVVLKKQRIFSLLKSMATTKWARNIVNIGFKTQNRSVTFIEIIRRWYSIAWKAKSIQRVRIKKSYTPRIKKMVLLSKCAVWNSKIQCEIKFKISQRARGQRIVEIRCTIVRWNIPLKYTIIRWYFVLSV